MIAIVLAAALATASTPPSPPKVCEPARLEACEDTNRLMWSKPFIADLTTFVGQGKASWLYPDGNKIDQVIAVLGGPPEVPVKVAGGLLRFAACRHHSCQEKGVAFLTVSGEIKAVGVLHFNCAKDCDSDYRLTLLVRQRDPQLMALAEAWAGEVIEAQNRTDPAHPHKLLSVEIDQVR